MTHRLISDKDKCSSLSIAPFMPAEKSKSRLRTSDSVELLRRMSNSKATDCLFQPIASSRETSQHRKPPSPFQTGLRYLKLLGQIKRQEDENTFDLATVRPSVVERLKRTSAFSTNYYAPLPPLPSHAMNKSIQVEEFDDSSYTSAVSTNDSHLSLHDCLFTFLSLFFFVGILLYIHGRSSPIHCLFNGRFWYPDNISTGFSCQDTPIELHYVAIQSTVYQLEIHVNTRARNCLGFDILSCMPIDDLTIPRGQVISHNEHLAKLCQQTERIDCSNQSLSIPPNASRWHLKNDLATELYHCACASRTTRTRCFHWTLSDQCSLQIPWLEYCLMHSTSQATCRAYIQRS